MSLYNPGNNEENVKNGLVIMKKSRLLGFILVFGMGCLGALYYGWKHAVKLFLYSIGISFLSIITFIIPNPVTSFIAGVLALFYLFKCITLVTDDSNHFEFTEKGLEEKQKWDKEADEVFKKTVSDLKGLTANALTSFADKIKEKNDFLNHKEDNCFCGECGKKVLSASKFCNSCGTKLNEAA